MLNLLTRVLRLIALLFSTHVEMARHEASRDARRLAGGVLLMGAALLLLAPAALLGHAAAVWWVHDTWPIEWPMAMLAVAVADLACGVPLLVWGRRRLRGPLLKETRGLVRRTASALSD
jgi:hypothetical protein